MIIFHSFLGYKKNNLDHIICMLNIKISQDTCLSDKSVKRFNNMPHKSNFMIILWSFFKDLKLKRIFIYSSSSSIVWMVWHFCYLINNFLTIFFFFTFLTVIRKIIQNMRWYSTYCCKGHTLWKQVILCSQYFRKYLLTTCIFVYNMQFKVQTIKIYYNEFGSD